MLGLVFANYQSIRWMTQGRILKKAANQFRRAGIRALDVGSGGGGYAIDNHLLQGTPTMLCDFSADLLSLAKRQVVEAKADSLAEFTQCSAEALPFADGEYDFIQCMEVLEHLHHPEKALGEFRRVARPGARLIVSVPHPPEWFPNPEHVVEGYRVTELTNLIETAGWRVVHSEYCMLIGSRLVLFLLHRLRFPLPLNPFVGLENFIPSSWRHFFLPSDLVVIAETAS